MKIRHLTDDVLQLTQARFVNAYLVRGEDGFTLIDTGLGRAAGAFVAAAREAGAPIVRIALTHAHSDHAGGVDALRQLLGDTATIYLGTRMLVSSRVSQSSRASAAARGRDSRLGPRSAS